MNPVQNAIDFIETHLHEPMKIQDISDAAFLSQAQLYRYFYTLTGHPVKDYIRKRRTSEAASLLRQTKRPVTPIALECGFASYYSFAKIFKKMVGLSPLEYREAATIFSFEPFSLRHNVFDQDRSSDYPDITITRLWPIAAYSFLHDSSTEQGIESAALGLVIQLITMQKYDIASIRIFGMNVDLPPENNSQRYGYKIILTGDNRVKADPLFQEEWLGGGLYAVRTIDAHSPEGIVAAWNKLLEEWLPKSRFDRGKHAYLEEFIVHKDKAVRMQLYLPVVRKLCPDPISIVEQPTLQSLYIRETGDRAKEDAEQKIIDWYRSKGSGQPSWNGSYYISSSCRSEQGEEYWWENGIIGLIGPVIIDYDSYSVVQTKWFPAGLYACVKTGTYGKLTGILDNINSWLLVNECYRFDGSRQWYAVYELMNGGDLIKDTFVRVYVPIMLMSIPRLEHKLIVEVKQ